MSARIHNARLAATFGAGLWVVMAGSVTAAPKPAALAKMAAPAQAIAWPAFQPAVPALRAGEKLTYDVHWEDVYAGQIVLEVQRRETFGTGGTEVWRVRCDARSSPFLSSLFEIHDVFTTLIDAREGFAQSSVIVKNEGALHGTESVAFRYEQPGAILTKIKRKQSGVSRTNVVDMILPGKVHDPLSYLYALRAQPLASGGEYRATVNADRKNWLVTLRVVSREEITLAGLGTFVVRVVSPAARSPDGASSGKLRLTAWVDEQTRIPLLLRLVAPLGSVTITLITAEKSPLVPRRLPQASGGGRQ